jgi:hypothetical protein
MQSSVPGSFRPKRRLAALLFGWVYLLLALRCLALDLQGLFSTALGPSMVSLTGETCWGFELSTPKEPWSATAATTRSSNREPCLDPVSCREAYALPVPLCFSARVASRDLRSALLTGYAWLSRGLVWCKKALPRAAAESWER